MIFMICGVVVSSLATTLVLRREVAVAHEQLELADANGLILLQQVDAIAEQYLSNLPADEELSDQDMATLSTWVRYDKKFLKLNQGNSRLRFERSLAAHRVSDMYLLLGHYEEARAFYDQEVSLLELLRQDYPNDVSYFCQHLDGLACVALVAVLCGEDKVATQVSDHASHLITTSTIPRTDDADRGLGGALRKLSEVMLRLGRIDAARDFAAQLVAANERLAESHPEMPEYAKSAEDARQLLAGIPRG